MRDNKRYLLILPLLSLTFLQPVLANPYINCQQQQIRLKAQRLSLDLTRKPFKQLIRRQRYFKHQAYLSQTVQQKQLWLRQAQSLQGQISLQKRHIKQQRLNINKQLQSFQYHCHSLYPQQQPDSTGTELSGLWLDNLGQTLQLHQVGLDIRGFIDNAGKTIMLLHGRLKGRHFFGRWSNATQYGLFSVWLKAKGKQFTGHFSIQNKQYPWLAYQTP